MSGTGFGRGFKRFQPYDRNSSKNVKIVNFDRNCVECGILIRGQAHEKPLVCPRVGCRFAQPFRHGWGPDGWGRCSSCDHFMRVDQSYCQCGWPNVETIERKRRKQLADSKAEEFKRAQYIKDLEKQLKEKQREVDDLYFERVVVPEVQRLKIGELVTPLQQNLGHDLGDADMDGPNGGNGTEASGSVSPGTSSPGGSN